MTGNRNSEADEFLPTTQRLVLEIARVLVDQPDKVSVEITSDATCDTLHLRLAPEDIGRLIGEEGRTIRSIRAIVSAASSKAKRKLALEIDNPSAAETESKIERLRPTLVSPQSRSLLRPLGKKINFGRRPAAPPN